MHPYIIPLSEAFIANANEENAFFMKKYMKGQYDYFGIKSPERREIMRDFLKMHGLPNTQDIKKIAKEFWQLPQREYQYVILEVLGKMAKKAEKERIDLYEYLIVNKSWWDTIDYSASNLVGVHFQKFPELIQPYTEKWMDSGNMWLQRTSLLFQLKYKKATDLELLTDYIHQLQGSKEFFINKAIGWILREYSKTNAAWVVDFVNSNQLAPLSHREALKWLNRKRNS